MSIEIWLSGLFFLLIIVLLMIAGSLGYKTFGGIDPEAQLQLINADPKKFKISFGLVLIEHFTIISLAITLFIAFNSYNIILGIVWCLCRISEGLIQINDKRNYWELLNIASKFSSTNEAEKDKLINLTKNILKTKNNRFILAQILFSIGTLSYSILFVTYGVVPIIIGWFGIIAAVIYGLGNAIYRIQSKFEVLWNIGGLLILIFEFILGGWLLLFP